MMLIPVVQLHKLFHHGTFSAFDACSLSRDMLRRTITASYSARRADTACRCPDPTPGGLSMCTSFVPLVCEFGHRNPSGTSTSALSLFVKVIGYALSFPPWCNANDDTARVGSNGLAPAVGACFLPPDRFLLSRAAVGSPTMAVLLWHRLAVSVQPAGFLPPRGHTCFVPGFWFRDDLKTPR